MDPALPCTAAMDGFPKFRVLDRLRHPRLGASEGNALREEPSSKWQYPRIIFVGALLSVVGCASVPIPNPDGRPQSYAFDDPGRTALTRAAAPRTAAHAGKSVAA